jgi:hypothetical protein
MNVQYEDIESHLLSDQTAVVASPPSIGILILYLSNFRTINVTPLDDPAAGQ